MSRWNIMENNRTKILWDFQMQKNRQYGQSIMVVDKDQKTVVVIDVAMPGNATSGSSMRSRLEA